MHKRHIHRPPLPVAVYPISICLSYFNSDENIITRAIFLNWPKSSASRYAPDKLQFLKENDTWPWQERILRAIHLGLLGDVGKVFRI